MRNLKRVLSLTLATAMLFGMMVMGASAADKKAADLPDMDKVINKEAVTLLADIGIVEGTSDGVFAPTTIVNRATMAKLITVMMMGDVDQNSFKGTTTDLKDVNGHWAEGYIKFCYSNGIITGDGAGSFFPDQPVTTVQAAKMLLVAIGYNADDRGYQNDGNWSVNIMKDAQSTKLYDGKTVRALTKGLSIKATDSLSRDNAAQMIFNTLFVATQKPEYQWDNGKQYISKYVAQASMADTTYNGLVRVTAMVTGVTGGKATMDAASSSDTDVLTDANALTALTGKLPGDASMLASTVVAYVADGKLVSSTLIASDSNTLYTLGGAFKSAASGTDTLTALLITSTTKVASLETGKVLTDLKFFYNGKNLTDATTNNSGVDTEAEVIALVGKNGFVVELKDTNSTAGVDSVVVTEKKVYTVSAEPTTKVVGDKTQVRIPGFIGSFSATNTTDTVKGFEGLVKDDVILVATIDGTNYIEKAEAIEGVVTGTDNNSNPKVDGTAYKLSDLTGKTNAWTGTDDYTNTWKFFLDNGKNIVKAVKVTNEEVTGDYTVVLDTKDIDGDLSTGSSIQAKFLMTDGTSVVANIGKVDGSKPANAAAVAKDKFYTYSINDKGLYDLKPVSGTVPVASGDLVNGKKQFIDGNTSVIGSENTTFVVALTNADGDTYKTYTGIASVPSMSGAKFEIIKKDGLAATVFVKVASGSVTGIDSDSKYFYIPDNTDYSFYPKTTNNSNEYYEFVAYVDGNKDTVKVNAAGKAIIDAANDKIFKASTLTDNSVYTNVALVTEGTGKVTVASGGTLAISGDSKAYSYDEDTLVYIINSDKELSVSNLKVDATDTVTLISVDGKHADIVFIREVINTAKDVSSVDVLVNGVKNDDASGGTTTGTITTIAKGAKVTLKVTVSDGATYTVSAKTVPTTAVNGNTLVFDDIVVTAENGDVAAAVTFTLTMTAVTG